MPSHAAHPQAIQWTALYDADDVRNALATMPASDIDRLPFGVIKVDRKSTVLLYNEAEGRFAGCSPATVIGRNFFRDIAPCTNRREFLGRFLEGVKTGRFDVTFQYVFRLRGLSVTVTVHFRNSYFDDAVWILVDWTADGGRTGVQAVKDTPSEPLWEGDARH